MPTKAEPIVQFVQERFRAKADAGKAVEMAAYMKTEMPFYGVQKPDRLPIYKELAKAFLPQNRKDYERNILSLWSQPHREEKYAALEYACMFPTHVTAGSLPLYEELIRSGAWWDFVDVVAINLVGHAFLNNRKAIKGTINAWSGDADMWIRRTSLICHNHHKRDTDQTQLFKTCLKLSDEKEFFIRKAIGWALREYSYVDPKAVQEFVLANRNRLSPLSFKEGTKQLVRSGYMKT
ncbi:MAG TPA: DNA alkylation repair protein [Trichormus sp.]